MNIATIAKAAGVSPAIVSRVMNADDSLRVRDTTRSRVLRVARQMDYHPNVAARSLRSSQTHLLALVLHGLANPVHAEIIEGARIAASRRHMAILLEDARDASRGHSSIDRIVGGGGVDALILQGAGTTMDKTLARAARRHMAIVHLQSGSTENATLITLDDETAARIATDHLLELGHRNIGFLGVCEALPFSRKRREGWKRSLERYRISAPPRWCLDAGSNYAQGESAVGALLAAAPEITAVVSANVVSAIGAMARLSDMSIRIPRDLSLVAIHDAEPAKYIRPSLSTVRLPLRKLGEAAVEVACTPSTARLDAMTLSNPVPKLVLRGSTAPRGSGRPVGNPACVASRTNKREEPEED